MDSQHTPNSSIGLSPRVARTAFISKETDQLTAEIEASSYFSGLVLHITSKLGGVSYDIQWRHCVFLPGGFMRMYEVKKPQIFRGEVDLKNAAIEVPAEAKGKKYDKIKLPPPLTKDTIIEGERAYIYIRSIAKTKSAASKVAEIVSKSASTTVLCTSSTKLELWLEQLRRATKLGPVEQSQGYKPIVETGRSESTPSMPLSSAPRTEASIEFPVAPKTPADIFASLAKARNAPPTVSIQSEKDMSFHAPHSSWAASSNPKKPALQSLLSQRNPPVSVATPLERHQAQDVPASAVSQVSPSLFDSPFAAELTASPFDIDEIHSTSETGIQSPSQFTKINSPFDDVGLFSTFRSKMSNCESTFLLDLVSSPDDSLDSTPFYLEDIRPQNQARRLTLAQIESLSVFL